jgi:hypothetical protein
VAKLFSDSELAECSGHQLVAGTHRLCRECTYYRWTRTEIAGRLSACRTARMMTLAAELKGRYIIVLAIFPQTSECLSRPGCHQSGASKMGLATPRTFGYINVHPDNIRRANAGPFPWNLRFSISAETRSVPLSQGSPTG